MASAVLDASAALAILLGETGSEQVDSAVADGAAISAVNLAEVVGVLTLRGVAAADIRAMLDGLGLEIREFSEEDGYATGLLAPLARGQKLSFGDRACLALGRKMALPVLTGDVDMANAPVGVDPEVILFR